MTETQQLPDLRPLLLRAVEVADSLVSLVSADDVRRPTPCDEFDVQSLVDHLVLVVRRIPVVIAGGDWRDAVPTGAADLDEVLTAWRADVAALRDAVPTFDLSLTVTAPFGTAPGAIALGVYVSELTVHSWDLARGLDRDDLLDPALAEPLVEPARANIPFEREGIPFGPVVEVADDAPAYDRLIGWYGRDPHWTA